VSRKYEFMNKKSFIVKSSAFVFGLIMAAACSNADSPIEGAGGEVIPDVDIPTDLTEKVATDGWGQGGFAGSWAAPEITTADGRKSAMAEVYKSTNEDVAATGVVMQQTIEGVPNGHYTVELYANAMYTPDRGFDSDLVDGAMDVVYVFANEAQTPVKAQVAVSTGENGEYTIETDVTDGTLTIGIAKAKGGTNWHTIQIKSVTGSMKLADAYATLIPVAESLLNAMICNEAEEALQEAINAPKTLENFNALGLAITLAQISAESFETVASGVIPTDKMNNWICTNDKDFHINTWSVEGNEGNDPSGMTTPFLENWMNKNDGTLPAGTEFYYTLIGLEPGMKFSVSALIRAYSEAGNDISGAVFFVGDSEKNISEGTAFEYNGMKGIYGTYTAEGTTNEDGSLYIGVKLTEPTFNWVAIKNISITLQ
jgi:hypothetical protein